MKQQKSRKLIFFSTLLLIVIATFFSTITVNAAWSEKKEIPIPTVQKNVYVYDEDNIIEDDIEKQVNALLVSLEEQTGAEVAVITVESLLDKEIEDYANDLSNTLEIGKEDEDNGVLLLISKSDERVRLEIGRGLEGCLNDSKCGRILDDYFVPYREKNEYSEGTYQTVKAVVSVIAEEYDTSIDGVDQNIAQDIQKREEKNDRIMIRILIIMAIIIAIIFFGDYFFLGGAIASSIFSGNGGGGFSGGRFGGGGASR